MVLCSRVPKRFKITAAQKKRISLKIITTLRTVMKCGLSCLLIQHLIDYRCILTLECFIVLLGGATVDVNFVASTEPSKNTKRKSDNSKVRKIHFLRQQI